MDLFRKHNLTLFFLLPTLVYCMFFHRLGATALLDYDEPRYAESAREMIELRSWLIPYFNYEVRLNKPIFFYWLMISAYKTLGVSEFSARIWSAIAGCLGVGLTYVFGKRVFNHGVGLAAALILASTALYAVMARAATTDMVLSLFITASLMSFFLHYRHQGDRNRYFLICILSLALGTLTKGPVGAILPALIIIAFLLLTGNLMNIRKGALFRGSLLFMAITLPWYIYAYCFVFSASENINALAFDETIGRFFGGYGHPHPVYYYIPVLLGTFFPWSFFLPLSFKHLVAAGWQKRMDEQPELLFIFLWFAGIFLFFSLCRCKLASYLLPIAPPLALLVGNIWHRYLTERDDYTVLNGMKRTLLTLAVSLLVVGCAGLIVVFVRFRSLLFPGLIPCALFISSGIILAKTDCAGKRWRLFFAMAAVIGFFFMLCIHLVSPQLEEWRSTKSFFFGADGIEDTGALFNYGRIYPSSVFYSRKHVKRIKSREQMLDFFESKQQQFCFISKSNLSKLDKDFHTTFTVLKENKALLLITNTSPALRDPT